MIYLKANKLIAFIFIASLILLSACNRSSSQNSESTGNSRLESGFVHAVYFYLHDTLGQQTKDDFLLVLDTLATIPSLRSVYYGRPANTQRRVVDNSYDYAFICVFDNKEGHDAYQEHPIHVSFKKQYTPLIQDIKIYDNVFGEAVGYEQGKR